jgi:hypothetical protein
MVLDGDIGFTTFWVALAIGLYIFMGAFAGIFFAPALRRADRVGRRRGSRIDHLRCGRQAYDDRRRDHHGPDRRHPVSHGHEAHALTSTEGCRA